MNQIKLNEKQPEGEGRAQSSPTITSKVLNVSIPASVYWHLRFCASESRMSIKAFMAEFCKTAMPIIGDPVATDPTTEAGNVPILESLP